MDIAPIIPDYQGPIKEQFSVALTKFIRSNEHRLVLSFVKYEESSIRIELIIKADRALIDELQSIVELKE